MTVHIVGRPRVRAILINECIKEAIEESGHTFQGVIEAELEGEKEACILREKERFEPKGKKNRKIWVHISRKEREHIPRKIAAINDKSVQQ
jgi:hypothetical protein